MLKNLILFWLFTPVFLILGQDFNTSDQEDTSFENREIFFDHTGYPESGDIPLLNRKIYRGARVTIREHPYVVSIRRFFAHYLTGSIITKNLILTIAHPLIGVPINELGVVVGENYSDRGTALLTVILIVIHENFDRHTLSSDLAMIRIYEDLQFRSHVKSISLRKQEVGCGIAMVTGWGRCDLTGNELCFPRASRYFPDEKVDPMLRTITFPIQESNLYCRGYKLHGTPLKSGMLCVGVAREEKHVASCLAVPGAPLVVNSRLLGILSWGFGCGYANDLPLVYTSLPYYESWIENNVLTMHKISKQNAKELFTATKSYILLQRINKTRVKRPIEHVHSQKLYSTSLDQRLIKLVGTVYDFRDFIYDKKYGEVKQNTFTKLQHLSKMAEQADNLNVTITSPQIITLSADFEQ